MSPHLVVAQREGVQADVVEEQVGHVVAILGVGVVPRRARELVTCAWSCRAGRVSAASRIGRCLQPACTPLKCPGRTPTSPLGPGTSNVLQRACEL